MNYGRITNCYATGYISARTNAGGIYSLAGLVGKNYYNGTITDCYTACYISSSHPWDVDGLVGINDGTIDSTSFWNRTTTGTSTSDSGTGIPADVMRMLSTFTDAPASWDFKNTWQMQDGLTFPYLHIGIGGPPPVEGDLNGDGGVDFNDFRIISNNWLAGK